MSKQLPDYKVVCLDKSSLDQAMTDGYLMLAVLPGLNEQAPDMALLRLTCHDDVIEVNCATAEQATAERADLDERLASIERHLERIDGLEADNKELHKLLGQCFGKAEQADGKANVAVNALFGDVDASIKALQTSTARLKDELIAIRQNQEWRPAEGEAPDDETDERVADFAREAEREQRIRYGD